jgi:glutamine amidotransferase
MQIAVIDYGSGNVRSATRAFEKAAEGLSATVTLTSRAEEVLAADRIVLPGQGAFADCMKGLESVPGMVEALTESVIKNAKPFFGICVGMQLLADRGLEHGEHKGLGWISGDVGPMIVPGAGPVVTPGTEVSRPLKIPHMGWNTLALEQPQHPLLKGVAKNSYVYFVHSYVFNVAARGHLLASCDYGGAFAASVVKDNICGTQFHVEKSQKTGLQLIRNFLEWRP